MSEPLDLDKIMAEHADHGEGVWCGATPSVVDEQDPDPDNCLPYRLAAELARRDQQISAVRALANDARIGYHPISDVSALDILRALDGAS